MSEFIDVQQPEPIKEPLTPDSVFTKNCNLLVSATGERIVYRAPIETKDGDSLYFIDVDGSETPELIKIERNGEVIWERKEDDR